MTRARRSAFPVLAMAFAAAVAPHAGAESPPPTAPAGDAAAWLVRVAVPSGSTLAIADVTARTGSSPSATASPMRALTSGPFDAVAVPGSPDKAVTTPFTWSDPTGSLVLEGGFAEAHAAVDTASARAGFGSATGSGFALASSLLTWDQQVQLLDTVAQLNDTLVDPLNDVLQTVAPALAVAGIHAPSIDKLSGAGLINVGGGRALSADAEVASGQALATSKADASIGTVTLLGGFIEAHDVDVEATGDAVAPTGHPAASVTIGSLRIAGVAVVADGDGFHVAGNDLLSRTVVQPALDTLLGGLAKAGITIHAGDRTDVAGRRVARGLEVAATTAAGTYVISVAHAEAFAPPVPSSAPAAAPDVAAASPEALVPYDVARGDLSGTAPISGPRLAVDEFVPPAAAATSGAAPTPRSGVRAASRLPRRVASALGLTFLLLTAAATGAALLLPAVAARRRRLHPRRETRA